MKIALCFLVWNELQGCQSDIPKLDLSKFEQVYAVDGGSTDGTVEYLTEQGIEVYPQPKKGYNQAYIFAFEKCNCDALIFFHPKGTVPINHIYIFRPFLEQGFDLVIASRLGHHSRNEEDDKIFKYRKWFVILLARISAMIWKKEGNTAWDVLHGFRAMKKSAFEQIDPLPHGLAIDLEMVIRSYKKKFSIIEFPTHETNCEYRGTHFKALPTGIKLLKYLKFELFRKNSSTKQV